MAVSHSERSPTYFSGSVGEIYLVIAEAKGAEESEGEVEDASDLGFQLVWAAEDMGVVLGETPDPEEAVEDARPLVAVDGAQLRKAHGKLPVASEGRPVHEDVEGAVHGFQVVVLVVYLQGCVHVFAVELEVAAGLPEPGLADVGRIDQRVAGVQVKLPPEVLHQATDPGALRMPADEAGPELVVDGEEAEVSAQLTVVSLGGFFEAVEVGVEGVLGLEGGAVDALEHGAVFVAAPVGAGDVQELEGGHLAGGLYVGAVAEV